MSVAGLIQELTQSSLPLDAAFARALDQLDAFAFSSAAVIRKPLAQIVVADRTLLGQNFCRHSVAELATSQTLDAVASRLKPTPLRKELLAHAADERRHSRIFSALAMSLGQTIQHDSYGWILQNDWQFIASYNGDVTAFVCDLFAGEVRTHLFLSAYVDALNVAEMPHAERISRILHRILADERRHVSYTAHYINKWIGEQLELTPTLQRSFANFNRNSWIEVAETSRYFYEQLPGKAGTPPACRNDLPHTCLQRDAR